MSKMQWVAALAMDAATRVNARRHRGAFMRNCSGVASVRHAAEALERRLLLSVAPVYFHPQQSFNSGGAPDSVAVVDFNGDGKPDIVVANYSANTVSIMLGVGDGTFVSPAPFATGPTPNEVVVADVNHDGTPDAIVADGGNNKVSVLLGKGDGTLNAQTTFAVGTNPRSVVVGDLNKDGKLDLAVLNFDSTVSVLLGNGNGTFQAQTTIPAATQTRALAIGDLNGDGNLDIVTAASTLVVDFGDGQGGVASSVTTPLASQALSVAVADISGDGKPDVVLAYPNNDTIGVMLGSGSQTLNTVQTYSTGMGVGPEGVSVADVNGDGKPDVVAVTLTNTMEVLLGSGNGTLGAASPFGTATYGYTFAVADVNGDGKPDLVAPHLSGSDVKVLLNDPPPVVVSINRAAPATATTQATSVTFTVRFSEPVSGVTAANFSVALDPAMTSAAPTVAPPSGPSAVFMVTFSGITGNGNVALNLVGINSSTTIVNDVGELLKPAVGFATAIPFNPEAYDVTVADMDGDGKPDLILADLSQHDVSVVLGNGDGITQPPQSFSTDISGSQASAPSGVAVADLNGDGKLDVVASESDDNEIGVFIGNGNGTLQPQVTYPLTAGADPISIKVADFNADGKPDLIVADYMSGSLGFLAGNGNGTFNPVQNIAVGSFPVEFVVADLNGDGLPDLVAGSQGAQSIGTLMGFAPPHGVILSSPPFRPEQNVTVGGSLADFQVGDVNGDGKLDLIVDNIGGVIDHNPQHNNVQVLEGDGLGGFAAPIDSVASLALFNAKLVDMNGDGKLDMIGVDQSSNAAMMLGNGDGTFQDEREFNVGKSSKLFVADMNRDGNPDAILAGGVMGTPGILLNSGSNEFDGQAFTILPRDATLAVNGAKVVFDGTPHPATFTAVGTSGEALSSLVGLSYTDISNNTSNTTPPTQVGTYEVFASFSGNSSYNAIPQFDTGKTVVISARPLGTATLTVTGGQVVFDGAPHTAIVTAVGTSGEDLSSLVSLTYKNTANNATSALAPSQIGNYEIFASFSGNDSYYPIDSFDTGKTIFISAHALSNVTLTVTGGNAVFDGNPHPATATAIGTSGEDLSSLARLTYTNIANETNSAAPPTQLGTYEIFASFIGNDSYYPISQFDTGKTIVISSHLLSNAMLTVAGADALFDGNPHQATVTAIGANGEDLSSLAALTYTNTASHTSSAAPPTQTGTYEVFATFAGNDSYNSIAIFDTGKTVVISPLSALQSVPSGKLPTASLIAGQNIKPIHLNVKITNNGASAVTEEVTLNVALSASANGTPEDPVVATIKKTVKLKTHQTAALGSVLLKSLPAGLNGTEHLVFKLTDASGAANLATAGTLSVGPATNDLAALSVAAPPKASLGKKVIATVAVMQNGNIPLIGTLPVELFLSTTPTIGAGAIDLGLAGGHVSILPGKKGTLHLSSTIPSTAAPGSYFLIAQLDPANTLADVIAANNIAASARLITVS